MSSDIRLDQPEGLPPEFKGWLIRYLENELVPALAFLRLVTPGAKAEHGSSSWTWAGASGSSTAQVTHNLGSAPTRVFVTPGSDSGLNLPPAVQVIALTATTFDVQASTVDAQVPGLSANCAFYWLAIV